MQKRNAFYAQSGGVTAVINATACGVIQTARKHKARIGKVAHVLDSTIAPDHDVLRRDAKMEGSVYTRPVSDGGPVANILSGRRALLWARGG